MRYYVLCNFCVLPRLLLVGCFFVAMVFSNDVSAQCDATGGAFAFPSVESLGLKQGGAEAKVAKFTYTVEQSGGQYSGGDIPAREAGTGAFVVYLDGKWRPARHPADGWFIYQLQVYAQDITTPVESLCLAEQVVSYGHLFFVTEDGWDHLVNVSWLAGDHDNDTIINLHDPDALVECDLEFGVAWEDSDCAPPFFEPAAGLDSATPIDSAYPDIPHITGSVDDFFGCPNPPFGAGTGAADYSCSEAIINGPEKCWSIQWWLHHDVFGEPSHSRPYVNPYSLLRAGPGGGVDAYFSAPWGKYLAFCWVAATDDTDAYRYNNTAGFFWHRYVIMRDVFEIQYWRDGDQCWTTLYISASFGVSAPPDDYGQNGGAWMETPAGVFLTSRLRTRWLTAFVPSSLLPGAMAGETESNTALGRGTLPDSNWYGETLTPIREIGGGLAGGTGYGPVTGGNSAAQLEGAMLSALTRASRGQAVDGAAAMGAMLGEGGPEAVTGLFGSGYTDAGLEGVGAAVGEIDGEGSDGVTAVTDIVDGSALGGASPDEYSAIISIPQPGTASSYIDIEFSTKPDVSTDMGAGLDVVRIFMRLVLSVIVSWRFGIALLGVFKELT